MLKDLALAYGLKCLLALLRLFPLKASLYIIGLLAKFLGKFSSRNKIVINNLTLAYPQKSLTQIKAIASQMWMHMGYLLVEYMALPKIINQPNNIIVENSYILEQIAKENKPHIFFTAHIGNFELLPILAQLYKVNIAVLFRPPNNRYIAKTLLNIRKKFIPSIIASTSGAALHLNKKLANNENIGVLIDQKYNKGLTTNFFNKPVKTNPLAIKLAVKFNCDIYPALCLRTGKAKYKIILYKKMSLIQKDGKVDLKANCQKLNDIVEQWVDTNPEQWMWFHNRWKI